MLAFAATCLVHLHAQAPPLSVTGRVLDASGGAIRGVRVSVFQNDRSVSTPAVSDDKGAFTLRLAPGTYAYQDAWITSATTAARAGAQVAQVPHHMFSLWNNYQLHPRLAAGLGVLNRSNSFAAVDSTVTLPSYTRTDAAVFVSLTERLRLQANVENLFNRKYFINADTNTNISPGFRRAARVALLVRF